jgi:methionyl aminopeptidase
MIIIKSDQEIDAMKEACKFSGELLDLIGEFVKPGISTLDINQIIHEATEKRGGISAPLNYHGFPKSVCTSVNEVVCHGIPSGKTKLREGDIINIDVTPILGGYHGDSSRMFYVGKVNDKARKLVECSRKALFLGINEVKVGARIGNIGAAIQEYVEGQGFSVVREFVGHGVGKVFHEDPQVPHFGQRGKGPRMREGMVFTIEPMVNEGHWKTKVLKDNWTAITVDGGLSAQWEHTIAIRSTGEVEILTESELEKSTRPEI